MLDSTRIIVPPNAIKSIMKELNRAHSGIEKMYKTAVQLYFWSGMKNTIKQAVDSCAACREDRPAQARPTAKIHAPSEAAEPMRHVGTDLFDAIGKKWIVLVDRYSGYAWTHQLKRTDTATVTAQLSNWFTEYGWPSTLRSDGGHSSEQNSQLSAATTASSTSSPPLTTPNLTGWRKQL